MSREEAIEIFKRLKENAPNEMHIETVGTAQELFDMAIQALSQEPCTDAQERYEDLCEYFGDAKDILKSRKDFKAWLERVKWHIHKAEELYEKYEYKKDPCTDAVSREAVLDEIEKWVVIELQYTNAISRLIKRINELPPVTSKSETVTEFADRCRECGARYGKLLKQKLKQKSEKWIPFSERLPKPFEHCLITTTDGEVIYHYDDGHYSKYKAWMPLPKPYEPQERSE